MQRGIVTSVLPVRWKASIFVVVPAHYAVEIRCYRSVDLIPKINACAIGLDLSLASSYFVQ